MPLYRRVPMRGFNNSNFQKSYEIVNLSSISKIKAKNIDSEVLFKNGLISSLFAAVKILGNGDIDKAYNITATIKVVRLESIIVANAFSYPDLIEF